MFWAVSQLNRIKPKDINLNRHPGTIEMLYFAYGSNMSSKRIQARVPSAHFVTVAVLDMHTLRFHKVSEDGSAKCDAYETEDSEDRIYGVVYDIADGDKPALDTFEGVGFGYEEKTVELISVDDEPMLAYTYCATYLEPDLHPYDWYHHHVITGAQEYDLPPDYIEQIRSVRTISDPDSMRHRRELAIYD